MTTEQFQVVITPEALDILQNGGKEGDSFVTVKEAVKMVLGQQEFTVGWGGARCPVGFVVKRSDSKDIPSTLIIYKTDYLPAIPLHSFMDKMLETAIPITIA
jgi:hypothetical protein